jgi:serine protease Do
MINVVRKKSVVLIVILFLLGCGKKSEQGNGNVNPKDKSLVSLQSILPISASNPSIQNVQDDISNTRRNAITKAVEKLKHAVVGINVTQIQEYVPRSMQDDPFFQFFFPNYRYQREVKNLGSGFIISPEGYILTNEHVVSGAVEIIVSMMDGKKYEADVIGADYVTDVALLKIEGGNLPYCELGNSDDIIIGEWIIALGNPFGLFEIGQQPSVTVGVISSKNLDFGLQEDERLFQDMIQTDASINPGNSGGPMANALGQVIGMNTFIFTGSQTNRGSIGLGFASPINKVKTTVDQLIKFGKVDRQWSTGLGVDPLTPRVARWLGLRNISGVIIKDIEPGSPAEDAGLEVYDIIIAVNGENVSSPKEILNVLNTLDAKAGDIIPITFIRDRKTYQTKLKLGKVD